MPLRFILQVCTVFYILFFFFQRKNDPKKFQDLENRFTDPKITKTRECQVLKSLQKRILEDMQQSEIIVNYLADKYDNEPEKNVLSFLLYPEKLTLTFMTQGSVK